MRKSPTESPQRTGMKYTHASWPTIAFLSPATTIRNKREPRRSTEPSSLAIGDTVIHSANTDMSRTKKTSCALDMFSYTWQCSIANAVKQVAGSSGAGKSSIINALRGKCRGDEEFAPTSARECTIRPTAYLCSLFGADVVLWDLPGAGTLAHPSSTYIRDKGLHWLDIVVLVSASRVTELDHQLISGLSCPQLSGIQPVPTIFLRTKVDIDIDSARYDAVDCESRSSNSDSTSSSSCCSSCSRTSSSGSSVSSCSTSASSGSRRSRAITEAVLRDIRSSIADVLPENSRSLHGPFLISACAQDFADWEAWQDALRGCIELARG
mmetsp:Transcript_143461/g.458666  ORF Transcript_143461/g.458666 Transcript_143461/m.458666 type:complete len:324 (+) Transcript_143461:509-1480(+)